MSMHIKALLVLVAVIASEPAVADAPAPFNRTVEQRIRPQVARLMEQLARDGRAMRIDEVAVFNGADKFLPGKIALTWAHLIGSARDDAARTDEYIAAFRKTARLTIDDPNDGWGIYYYLLALQALHDMGRLQDAVDPLTFAKLRVRLDWRTFVDRDSYALIDHPNNYYCVAFAIARLRNHLGWEDDSAAERLYEAMTANYRRYSGPYGFADETEGEGRFDRYSILLAAEIAQRFMETGEKPPPQIIEWLRNSAAVMLLRLNPQGEGFEYGRSLGPYAATAIVEVLTAAAVLDVLDAQQTALAYTYASIAAARYADFWIDARTQSVNLWDGGRRTDAYRGKFRILGENLSLGHQFLYTNAIWNRLGFRNRPPLADFAAKLDALPRRSVTWFARGAYDRVLVTLRDGERIIGLPLINGGRGQHMHSPYFPMPFSPGMLEGVADGEAPFLTPRFELADGSVLMPLAYFKDVEVRGNGERTVVTYRQTELDRMGGDAPVADGRLAVRTTYVFEPGRITRSDVYEPSGTLAVESITMALGSHSTVVGTIGTKVRFTAGALTSFNVSGLDACETASAIGEASYETPSGPMRTKVVCRRAAFNMSEPITISWELHYQAQPRAPAAGASSP